MESRRELPLDETRRLMERSRQVIPGCSQTFSKGPSQFVQGVAPGFIRSAKGCKVVDVDGNEYIDYAMALGPVILGHAYPAVNRAVKKQMDLGWTFSLPHPLEVEVAETVSRLVPFAEMVRFCKNGSDATAGAIRAARAHTGRDVVLVCGYHGWQDWYIGSTTRSRGVPEAVRALTRPFAWNDIASLEGKLAAARGQVAAVILEVPAAEPTDGFLERVREAAHREGALFVMDEIVTGFRLAMDGAQGCYGVRPDLSCFGKAMGNGAPIACIAGRRGVMSIFDDIFFSSTFGGEAISLAACQATLQVMQDRPVHDHLWKMGGRLKLGIAEIIDRTEMRDYAMVAGQSPRFGLVFRDVPGATSLEVKSLFQQHAVRGGVLFTGGHNITYSHRAADVDRTLEVYHAAMGAVRSAIADGAVRARLEGTAIRAIFRNP